MKIYRSLTMLSFTVYIGGRRRYIRFVGHSRGGSYYVSKDKREQKAIEASPFFTDGVMWIAEEIGDKPATVEVSQPKEVVKVKSCHEAREWIVEHLMLSLPIAVKKEKLLAIAAENGVKFKFV